MQDLTKYREHHIALKEMIGDLQSLLNPEMLRIPPNAELAHHLLCDLVDLVKEHLLDEDRYLYPSLLVHKNPRVKALAWDFIRTERPLRRNFEKYYKKWLKRCDFPFSERFLHETQEIFKILSERIEREEEVLFPKLMEIGFLQKSGRSQLAL